mgnify:CR=1 FL=1
MTPSAGTLELSYPNVLSWSRPRTGRGVTRYEGPYAAGRDAWALLTRAAVLSAGWAPAKTARYRVDVNVTGGGKRDLARVLTHELGHGAHFSLAMQHQGFFNTRPAMPFVEALNASLTAVRASFPSVAPSQFHRFWSSEALGL